jgi:protein-disulfide isomerase
MKTSLSVVLGVLATTLVLGQDASVPPTPISTNRDDAPPRISSGKVFASTDASLPPALGPTPAKVVVVVFSDFQCPVCRRTADATDQLADEFPGEVRVEFWQHPLPMHASAENAAVAALAAHQQGKFWAFHDEVFRNQSAIDADSLARYAAQVGLDVDRFKTDYASSELRARAKDEAAFADRLGAHSTPAFMINGNLKMGWGSWNGFRGDVERELNEARKLEVQGVPIDQIASQRAQALIPNPELLQAYREKVLRPAPEPVKDEGKHKDKKNKKDKKGKN